MHADKRTELLHLAPSLIFTHLFFFTPLSKLSTKKTLQLCPPSLLPVKLAVNEAAVQRFDLQDCYLIFLLFYFSGGPLAANGSSTGGGVHRQGFLIEHLNRESAMATDMDTAPQADGEWIQPRCEALEKQPHR